jgi:Protein of unknown function (DUF992)
MHTDIPPREVMMRTFLIRASIALVLTGVVQEGLQPPCSAANVKIGVLTCQIAGGFGWIIGSSRTTECKFESTHGHMENYEGTVSTIGLDLGYLGACVMVWAVVAPGSVSGPGALAGTYLGASAQAAVGLGGGVNVMTGGRNSVALQPVSVTGDTGLYVGGGIAAMSLELVNY